MPKLLHRGSGAEPTQTGHSKSERLERPRRASREAVPVVPAWPPARRRAGSRCRAQPPSSVDASTQRMPGSPGTQPRQDVTYLLQIVGLDLRSGDGRRPRQSDRSWRFVIGAYSAISLRSDPSLPNRTTTIPPGSTPGDDALAERGVHDVVTEPERRSAACGLRGDIGAPRQRARPAGARRGARRGGAGPAGRGALAVQVLRRELAEEPARQPVGRRPEHVAPPRVRQREVAHRAGDADVTEAPLLLEVPLVQRARVRERSPPPSRS